MSDPMLENYKPSLKKRLKDKLKKIQTKKEKITSNTIIGVAFFSMIVGIIIFFAFLFTIRKEIHITSKNIEMDTTGQIGDFIGGVIGSIWALTGVLLFYAALRLQSKELKENRIHFQLSRLTDIIYKQLDFLKSSVDHFSLKDIDHKGIRIPYNGRAAAALIIRKLHSIIDLQKIKDEEINKKKSQDFMINHLAFIEINKQELLNFYRDLKSNTDTIRSVLIKDEIPFPDLNELKAIFFRNIGRDFLTASELLLPILETYIEMKKKTEQDYAELFADEYTIKTDIESITEFQKTYYDKETMIKYLNGRDMYNFTGF